jgi:threonylcarbamoyladenosine tRNA methylthiotransferase MtaB
MKVYLRTYGCRANQYDTEAVRAMLTEAGVEIATSAESADVAIFNSCTVTAEAEADLRAGVRAAARENARVRSIVIGCAAGVPDRNEALTPLATLPGVDAVLPGADLLALSSALGIDAPANRPVTQSGARALLRVQDGCDEHCTFCATTISRGANRSRAIDDIIGEATQLSATHPEIVITGIHIGTYGRDIGSSLGELVSELIGATPAVRFRLSSVEATEVDERLGFLLRDDPLRLAPHLHAPLQSGSDSVLRRMGRNWYSAREYERAVADLTAGARSFGLSADVIAGFPGETEDDHSATLDLIERLPFTSLHVFPYSARPGTAATRLSGQVNGAVARGRAAELRALAKAKADAYAASRVGEQCDVVVTERGKGLTEDYLSVSISDPALPRRARFRGTLASDGGLTATPS